MKKICKVLGVVGTLTATVITGMVLCHEGYKRGYNMALRDNDREGNK
ncbi:MAG: hypothetical protein LUG26_04610 [Ruminococcus sp.]|nr:hypothetical protein [Ruminococcus sp.]